MTEEASEHQAQQGVRLQVLISHAGLASRRAAEALILAGRVTVNGKTETTLGARAFPLDSVAVDGRIITAEGRMHHLALNKPQGYLCAMSDDFGRPLAFTLFKPQIQERIYNIGRLDLESCGLILFTNDGEFAASTGHPSSGLVKEYQMETDGRIPQEFIHRFEAGLDDTGETLKADSVIINGERTCTVRLVEGKNREIRRALSIFGLKALVLRRVSIGPVRLGNLAEGAWRTLSDEELRALVSADQGRLVR
jgi:23S rRNA pseudouridine2605 synthase